MAESLVIGGRLTSLDVERVGAVKVPVRWIACGITIPKGLYRMVVVTSKPGFGNDIAETVHICLFRKT
jgi:hypothetical protein